MCSSDRRALTAAIQRDGGKIFTNTHARKIEGGSPAIVETSNGFRIASTAVVVATNSPVNDRVAIHTKQSPYRTYVIGARVPADSVAKGLYWDTAQDAEMARQKDPLSYHYVRLQRVRPGPSGRDYDLLVVGGEDHKTGQATDIEARWSRLEHWTKERFPMVEAIEYRWSGQVLEPMDGLAFIGRNPNDEPNVYIATGDSGQGMTHGTIAGILLTDLILGRENEWAILYDPSRVRARTAGEFIRGCYESFCKLLMENQ